MENYSLLMGAAALMKMAVEMAAVSMEKPSGALPRPAACRKRLLSPDLGFAMAARKKSYKGNILGIGRNQRPGSIFPRSFRKTREIRSGATGAATHWAARPTRAPLACGAPVTPPTPPFRLLKAFVVKPCIQRPRYGKPCETPPNPISGYSRRSPQAPAGEGNHGGLYIIMPASGLMRLNFSSRNLLDSAAGGTFMSITLGAATKLLDDMMINYSEWHTERTPQGKKVNSVEETSSLGDKIDAIMSMLANDRSHIDPNNVPLASLVAQEENVDVNFIKSNNFNNNAYRNNYGNNNYRPYPSNNGNGYGNSYNNNKSVPSGLEVMLKEFISTQTAFNKTVEEKLGKIDVLASKVDSLALDVDLLKLKVMPEEVKDARFAKTNAIQVQINDNIRMLAELHARWDREEKEKLAKQNNVAKIWTITTTSNDDSTHVATPPTINGKIIGVGNVSTPSAKRAKLPETAKTACDKTAEFFQNIEDNDPIFVEHNGLDFDDCHITEVLMLVL
ncbi:hypothetical protein QYE76_057365 [Lolium multiflorum]|uniref:Uncharacterized protein n=1 Tax=Lolium multiflorum TaxID=4521 RepID=A0AAD8WP03_LOLMU|nr:hypothetical protein QYE76_057365 [Lolium multiflorum]